MAACRSAVAYGGDQAEKRCCQAGHGSQPMVRYVRPAALVFVDIGLATEIEQQACE